MRLSSMKVNSARAEAGDWVGDIPDMGDLRLHVRGFTNSDYAAFSTKESTTVSREQREGGSTHGAILPKVRDEIMVRGMVEHILLGWENLIGDDEQPIAYSKEQATAFLSDPDYRPLRNAVAWAAAMLEETEASV